MKREGYKSKIISKVIGMAIVSIFLVTVVFLVIFVNHNKKQEDIENNNSYGQVIIELNAIYNTVMQEHNNDIYQESPGDMDIESAQMINTLITELQGKELETSREKGTFIIVTYLAAVICIIIIFGVIYMLVLRPFSKLEDYAAEIATGNLDKELRYDRVNMFGEFTWAFDHMRREIKKARACEQEAVENNKTVIATLSHDIKTPIASIRAYGEALADNMDSTPERRGRYIDVIMKKCDEVTKITNDMFIHSLHDLDKLIIKNEEVMIHQVIKDTILSMEGGRTDIHLGDIKEAVLPKADGGRIAQVIENIINNSRKYAGTDIYITTEIISDEKIQGMDKTDSREYSLIISDKGPGILPEDMPFIFEKFYRGKNHGDEPGAGLGLFIVKYVMNQMDGTVRLSNENGLRCELRFKM